jgi:hypothetical protein
LLHETIPSVRSFFEEHSLRAREKARGDRPTLKHWLTQFRILTRSKWDEQAYDDSATGLRYAWERRGAGREPGALVTIWVEGVSSDDDDVWFYPEWLDPRTYQGGAGRDAGQQERAHERIRVLRHCWDNRLPFDALLLENGKTQAELMTARKPASAISQSLREEVQWRVHSWNEATQWAVLVRGPAVHPGWRPPGERDTSTREAPPHWSFPDQAHRAWWKQLQ